MYTVTLISETHLCFMLDQTLKMTEASTKCLFHNGLVLYICIGVLTRRVFWETVKRR